MAASQKGETMTRIVEHRSALPFGAVVEMRIHDVDDAPVLATLSVGFYDLATVNKPVLLPAPPDCILLGDKCSRQGRKTVPPYLHLIFGTTLTN
jgi:hypothetical protein